MEPSLPQPKYVALRVLKWGSGKELRLGHQAWLSLLKLAFDNGWMPEGTEEPEHWEFNPWSRTKVGWWSGDYFSNAGQRISDSDALSMAEAVRRGLPDVPQHDARRGKALWNLDLPWGPPIQWLDPRERISPVEFFSGSRRAVLDRFIEYCGKSGFSIC